MALDLLKKIQHPSQDRTNATCDSLASFSMQHLKGLLSSINSLLFIALFSFEAFAEAINPKPILNEKAMLFDARKRETGTFSLKPYKAVYEAEYQESIIPITVTGTRRFRPTNKGYWELSFKADTMLADLNEFAPIRIQGSQLIPDKYLYKTTGVASEYFEHVFNWGQHKVFDVKKDRFWNIRLIPGTQNNISYQEQMRQDIKAGKKAFSYPVAYRGKLKTYEFKVVGEETIDTKLGRVKCIKIEQLLNKYNKLTTFIWLSIKHDYTLVKINQKRGGKPAQEIRIQSLEFYSEVD